MGGKELRQNPWAVFTYEWGTTDCGFIDGASMPSIDQNIDTFTNGPFKPLSEHIHGCATQKEGSRRHRHGLLVQVSSVRDEIHCMFLVASN